MGQRDLFLEFKREGLSSRHHRLTTRTKLFVIGSSPEADLRIGGDGIMGCHAVLQYQAPNWVVRSLAVDGGAAVSINNTEVIESVLDESAERSTLQIGPHHIQLVSKLRPEHLFKESKSAVHGPLSLHQVVVWSDKGKVLTTNILDAGQSFAFVDGDQRASFASPPSADWVETAIGKKVIRQRLISAQEVAAIESFAVDKDMKRAIAASIVVMLLMLSFVFLIPKSQDKPELALDQKSIDMIFNADMIKKKRVESKKVTQTAKLRAGGSPDVQNTNQSAVSQPDQSMAPMKSEKATAALTSIRNSGLSSLVGKIAKRANKNGIMIAAQGTSADNKNAGRAFFSNGTSTTGGGGAAATAGDSYRLGGIATKGKGGGATGVRDGTGLAGGTVGTGDVAMVDEETVIEGGLDRDVIADVIRRNLGQIRYCYERQLSSNPDLYGKLLVRFTIDASGGVMEPKIDTSTLKSNLVEGCVLRRLAGWKFPLPKGGTQVRVSYPFLFKALD